MKDLWNFVSDNLMAANLLINQTQYPPSTVSPMISSSYLLCLLIQLQNKSSRALRFCWILYHRLQVLRRCFLPCAHLLKCQPPFRMLRLLLCNLQRSSPARARLANTSQLSGSRDCNFVLFGLLVPS